MLQDTPAETDDFFLPFAAKTVGFNLAVAQPRVGGPFVCQPDSHVRMHPPEATLQEMVVKNVVKPQVTPVLGIKCVAVPDEKIFPVDAERFIAGMEDDATLPGQIPESPDVMVAGKKMHWNPLVCKFTDLARKRTCPWGTARLYSNQKSKISPNRKSIPQSGRILSNHSTICNSRSRLSFNTGAPKWRSERK